MTNAEAIAELRNMQKFNYTLAPDEVFQMAISALEKQEGKKPEEAGLMGVHIPVCANCKNALMFITESARSDFCPKCGQKILWEGNEHGTD